MNYKYNLTKLKYGAAIILCILICISCRKLVEVQAPFTSVNEQNVFEDDSRAIAVLTGLYTNLSNTSFMTGNASVSLYAGLSADELTLYSEVSDVTLNSYYGNSLAVNSGTSVGSDFWSPLYSYIYICNEAIDGVNNSNSLTPSIKKQLLGEAKFMRAFFYFYLTNLFGDVPLSTTSDYKINSLLPRTQSLKVYQQIIADLKDAQSLLNSDYLDGTLLKSTTERVRPTAGAANALLARAYLYTKNWDSAKLAATSVINNSTLYSLDSLGDVFLKNSSEAIWQLQSVNAGQNTQDAILFILNGGPNSGSNPVYLSNYLLSKFEPGDERYTNWIGIDSSTGVNYYYPFKYKSATYGDPVTEYLMVLRLAEQYLIRAEAETQLNDLGDATNDLNMIRTRSGLSATAATTQGDLLIAILHERQTELFSEWGHRWLDLKRSGSIDSVMKIVTPGKVTSSVWNSYQQLYPILVTDIQENPNLVQNPGYN